jgi:hypothetical protein
MYVEVSGRQTGKTTRLVEDVVSFLTQNTDKSVLIVSFNDRNRQLIKRKITNKCGLPCLNRTITSHKMLPPTSSMKQYVDEFFYISENKLVVDENAYYCGTPENGLYGTYDEIYRTYKSLTYKLSVPIKPLKRHGF